MPSGTEELEPGASYASLFFQQREPPPPEFDNDTVERAASALIRGYGVAWLQQHGEHPVQRLWQRGDLLASQELLTLGEALSRVECSAARTRYTRFLAKLKDADSNNVHGIHWEALCAGLFDPSHHRAQLAPANTPGYDVVVSGVSGMMARVSCKSLLPSKHARSFFRDAERAYSALQARLAHGTNATLFVNEPPREHERSHHAQMILQRALTRALERASRGDEALEMVHDLELYLGPYAEDLATSAPLHPAYPAIRFSYLRGHHRNEQVRFEAKVVEAATKFVALRQEPIEGVANMIAIRIPAEINMASALLWLDRWWAVDTAEARAIDGALVYRVTCAPCSIDGGPTSHHLLHEAQVRWSPRGSGKRLPLRMSVAVGVCTSDPPLPMLLWGGQEISLLDKYVWQSGEETRSAAITNGEASGEFGAEPGGVVRHVVLTGFSEDVNDGVRLSPRGRPGPDLLILTPGSSNWSGAPGEQLQRRGHRA